VIASSGLGHVTRGIETWASDLAGALVQRGIGVTLCKGAGDATRPFERVIPCWRRESRATRALLALLPRRGAWRLGLGSGYDIEQLTFSAGLILFLRRRKPDILHVQDPLLALLVQHAHRVGLVRSRTILAHGTEEPPAFLRRIDYLQHLAPWHLEQAREAGAWRPTWTSIPNFVDTTVYRPGRAEGLRRELDIPPNAHVVLVTAAIKRNHKRVDHVIAEFARLLAASSGSAAWLIVAGGWEQETDGLIAEGKRVLGDRVRFLVRFPRARMPELYRAADVFCLASLLEMMPVALLEALASGLPCMVHRHPVMEWMIGEGGVAIDMAQPGSLAARVSSLLGDGNERARLGKLAREHCLANFSPATVIHRILEYYDVVADAPECPPRDAAGEHAGPLAGSPRGGSRAGRDP
jgi:glycosyltransferase involved in cell wall biosynthesis